MGGAKVIWKRCSRCGRRVEEGKTCTCRVGVESAQKRTDGIRKQYHTEKWKHYREVALARYAHTDLYALYHDGIIRPADRVHHIIPVLDNPDRFYDMDNYLPCSDASHHEIHYRMKREGKEKIQQELFSYRDRYRNEHWEREPGGY